MCMCVRVHVLVFVCTIMNNFNSFEKQVTSFLFSHLRHVLCVCVCVSVFVDVLVAVHLEPYLCVEVKWMLFAIIVIVVVVCFLWSVCVFDHSEKVCC